MSTFKPHPLMSPAKWLAALACLAALCLPLASGAQPDAAAALRASSDTLRPQLDSNAFGSPLYLQSIEERGRMKGEVHARVMQPFDVLSKALGSAAQWCDVLILHLNVKQCRSAAANQLSMRAGRKFDQPLSDAHPLDFTWNLVARRPDYFEVNMVSPSGPFGTSDYRIEVAAVPLDGKSSFLRMSYAYSHGLAARMAMQAYLATAGASKVGFTALGKRADGSAEYIGGLRGVLERNTMRYYLAIETYLASATLPLAQQQDRRIADWFDATERHALQLHEMERNDYIDMKRKEIARQREAP